MAVAGNEENGHAAPMETPRPGPEPDEADNWGDSEVATVSSGDYSGRHHVPSASRRRLVIGAGVVVVATVVAVPFAFSVASKPTPPLVAFDPALGQGVPPGSLSAGSDRASVSPSASPTRSAGGTSNGVTPTRSVQSPVATPSSTPGSSPAGAPPFTPVTVEAEAAAPAVTLGGSAWIAPYDAASSGRIVRNVGDWSMRDGPGSVRFNGITFPAAGTYVLTIAYVHPDGESRRSAQVTVSGLAPVTVTFTGSARCCDVKKVSLAIPAGIRTITIANSTGRAPSIDKITISSG